MLLVCLSLITSNPSEGLNLCNQNPADLESNHTPGNLVLQHSPGSSDLKTDGDMNFLYDKVRSGAQALALQEAEDALKLIRR